MAGRRPRVRKATSTEVGDSPQGLAGLVTVATGGRAAAEALGFTLDVPAKDVAGEPALQKDGGWATPVDQAADALFGCILGWCSEGSCAKWGGTDVTAALLRRIDSAVETLHCSRERLVAASSTVPPPTVEDLGLPSVMGPSVVAWSPSTPAESGLGKGAAPPMLGQVSPVKRRAWHEYEDSDREEPDDDQGSTSTDAPASPRGCNWGSTDDEGELLRPACWVPPAARRLPSAGRADATNCSSRQGASSWGLSIAPAPAPVPAQVQEQEPVDDAAQCGTLRNHLQELRAESPSRVVCLRKINRLGFDSKALLEHHFAERGLSARILVAHLFARPSGRRPARVRPAGVGFAVMGTREDALRVLAPGEEQQICGVEIQVQPYEPAMEQ